jgi:hypothetical protein
MTPSERVPTDIRGTVTHRFIALETEIVNIQYLLENTGLTEAQRRRLQSLLVTAETELREMYAQLDALSSEVK